ncbi:MAG: NADPH-dependent FMN reductase [bacterium]
MKIVAIGGSNSKRSINQSLANFTAELFDDAAITKVNISEIDLPIYSIDKESEIGIPKSALDFAKKIDETDLIVISLAENNGSFNVGLKNLLDWTSRIKDRKTFNNKPMLLMSTSPGARGGATVLESAKNLFPYAGAVIKATFSLPEFYKNFDFEEGITNQVILNGLKEIVQQMNHHDTSH